MGAKPVVEVSGACARCGHSRELHEAGGFCQDAACWDWVHLGILPCDSYRARGLAG